MKNHGYYLSLLLLFATACSSTNEQGTDAAGQLFYHGDIIPMEGDSPAMVEAVVEKSGKIAFVGTLAEAGKGYPDAHKVNLSGRTMLPGFIDPHSHFGMVSNTMGQVDLNPEPVGTVTSIEDILTSFKQYKAEKKIPDGEWIFGWGYDNGQLAEKRHPTKKDIDRVLPNNPVYLQHTSGHMGVANSLGLEKLQVSADTKSPAGGTIERFSKSNEPTGLVQETAMYPFVGLMLEKLAAKQEEFFDTTQVKYAANGITTAQDGMTDRKTIRFFNRRPMQKNSKLT